MHSRIREVNMFSFTEITSNFYDHLRGKYPNYRFVAKYWARVESSIDITTPSKGSFRIAKGLFYHNGKVCVTDLLEVKKRFWMSQ